MIVSYPFSNKNEALSDFYKKSERASSFDGTDEATLKVKETSNDD